MFTGVTFVLGLTFLSETQISAVVIYFFSFQITP